jgi:hypothetical protein
MLALQLAMHRRPIGLGTAAMARLLAGVRVKQGAKLGVAERHTPNSIATLRRIIAAALAWRLPRCPCCLHTVKPRNLDGF